MYKSKLQEMCAVKSWTFPKYSAVKYGPDHIPRFTASVLVNGVSFDSSTSCKSVKEAQNKAAEAALIHFISLSSTRLSDNLSPDGLKILEANNKSILPAEVRQVPKKNPDLKKQEENESNNASVLAINCNSKSVANPQETKIEAGKLDMNSLSLKVSSQGSELKLARAGISEPKEHGTIYTTNVDGSPYFKGKDILKSKESNAPAEASADLKKQIDPEASSFLLCNRVRVYTHFPDIANLPKGVTVLQICDDKWVAVSLDFPNEKTN